MKNLIYILIFLPSLLFSQETKNMEFVGVRNIEIHIDHTGGSLLENFQFEVDSNLILKLLSFAYGSSSYSYQLGGNVPSGLPAELRVNLNGMRMYFDGIDHINFPIYLQPGIHTLSYYLQHNSSKKCDLTLYGLEFKLTTP